jgi:hypothetical protein
MLGGSSLFFSIYVVVSVQAERAERGTPGRPTPCSPRTTGPRRGTSSRCSLRPSRWSTPSCRSSPPAVSGAAAVAADATEVAAAVVVEVATAAVEGEFFPSRTLFILPVILFRSYYQTRVGSGLHFFFGLDQTF